MTTERSTPGSTSRRGVAPMALGTGCEDSAPVGNSGSRLNFDDRLRITTWNCGGLAKTQINFCCEYNYDILALTETHDNGSFPKSRNIITAEPALPSDSFPGVALLLNEKVTNCVMYKGCIGSRIVYARVRAHPCNLLIIAVYLPHAGRKQKPFPADTLSELSHLLNKVNSHDCVILLGDLNCKLARNVKKLTGRWSVHSKSNPEGENFLGLMRKSKLVAISTFFQQQGRKTTATYLAKDPIYKPSQIDYVLISSRWATSITKCEIRWGMSINRWGRRYDHAPVCCTLNMKINKVQPQWTMEHSI